MRPSLAMRWTVTPEKPVSPKPSTCGLQVGTLWLLLENSRLYVQYGGFPLGRERGGEGHGTVETEAGIACSDRSQGAETGPPLEGTEEA